MFCQKTWLRTQERWKYRLATVGSCDCGWTKGLATGPVLARIPTQAFDRPVLRGSDSMKLRLRKVNGLRRVIQLFCLVGADGVLSSKFVHRRGKEKCPKRDGKCVNRHARNRCCGSRASAGVGCSHLQSKGVNSLAHPRLQGKSVTAQSSRHTGALNGHALVGLPSSEIALRRCLCWRSGGGNSCSETTLLKVVRQADSWRCSVSCDISS